MINLISNLCERTAPYWIGAIDAAQSGEVATTGAAAFALLGTMVIPRILNEARRRFGQREIEILAPNEIRDEGWVRLQSQRLISPHITSVERETLFQACMEMSVTRLDMIIDYALSLIHETMSCEERLAIVEILHDLPPECLESVMKLCKSASTKNIEEAQDVAEFLKGLIGKSKEEIDDLVCQCIAFMSKDPQGRAMVLKFIGVTLQDQSCPLSILLHGMKLTGPLLTLDDGANLQYLGEFLPKCESLTSEDVARMKASFLSLIHGMDTQSIRTFKQLLTIVPEDQFSSVVKQLSSILDSLGSLEKIAFMNLFLQLLSQNQSSECPSIIQLFGEYADKMGVEERSGLIWAISLAQGAQIRQVLEKLPSSTRSEMSGKEKEKFIWDSIHPEHIHQKTLLRLTEGMTGMHRGKIVCTLLKLKPECQNAVPLNCLLSELVPLFEGLDEEEKMKLFHMAMQPAFTIRYRGVKDQETLTSFPRNLQMLMAGMTSEEGAGVIQALFLLSENQIPRVLGSIMKGVLSDMTGKQREELVWEAVRPRNINKEMLRRLTARMGARAKALLFASIQRDFREIDQLFQDAPNIRSKTRYNPSLPLLRDLPRDLQWRLGIDREFHTHGPNYFDRDLSPGFRRGLDISFQMNDAFRDLRMTSRLMGFLHDGSVDEVFSIGELLAKGYAPGFCYPLKIENISEETRAELLEEWEKEKLILTPEGMRKIEERLRTNFPLLSNEELKMRVEQERNEYLAKTPFVIEGNKFYWISSQFRPRDEKKIDAIFDRFYQEAEEAKTMDQKYAAVVRCCRALLIFHALPDGNGRTIIANILNILLHQIGSPPALYVDTYLFEGSRTISQMVEGLKERIDQFQQLKLQVMIGELAGITPQDRDAEDPAQIEKFYAEEPLLAPLRRPLYRW